MNIPMLMSTDATTRSITRKGKNRANPIWNAARSSLVTKAVMRTTMGMSFRVLGVGAWCSEMKVLMSSLRVLATIKRRKGTAASMSPHICVR